MLASRASPGWFGSHRQICINNHSWINEYTIIEWRPERIPWGSVAVWSLSWGLNSGQEIPVALSKMAPGASPYFLEMEYVPHERWLFPGSESYPAELSFCTKGGTGVFVLRGSWINIFLARLIYLSTQISKQLYLSLWHSWMPSSCPRASASQASDGDL